MRSPSSRTCRRRDFPHFEVLGFVPKDNDDGDSPVMEPYGLEMNSAAQTELEP